MTESSEEYKGIVKQVMHLTERLQLLEHAQVVALDPTKFNIMVVRLPETYSSAEVDAAIRITEQLREWANLSVRIVLANGLDVEFAVQE